MMNIIIWLSCFSSFLKVIVNCNFVGNIYKKGWYWYHVKKCLVKENNWKCFNYHDYRYIGRKRSSFFGLPTNSRCVHKIPYCWKEQHRGTWCLALSLQLQRYLVYGTGRSSVVEPVIFWPAQAPIFFNWSQLRLFRPAPAPTLTRDPYKKFFSILQMVHTPTDKKENTRCYLQI